MAKKKDKKENPEVNDELKGFDIKINEFGEITTNFEIDRVNDFLNENVEDKKLKDNPPGETAEEGEKGEE